jgi:hypothetical protein
LSEKESRAEAENQDGVQPGYLGATPVVGQLPRKGQRVWVDRPEQLLRSVDALKQATVIAIDAEFSQARARLHTNDTGPRLALLQLAIDGQCFVLDTLRLQDLSLLNSVMEDPAYIFLFHGAGADMRFMSERGLHVAHYYDLEATSRSIFGQHESSLAAMLQRAFHMRLDKSLQRTDWTRRPLPPAMIAYAARDAEVTLALYHWLHLHYPTILKLYESTDAVEPVAAWIEPFLRGNAHTSPEVAVAEAKEQGIIHNQAQVYADSRAALTHVVHPMRRNRLLKLIADLSLVQLVPDILPLLHAATSDERAGSARALGRLGMKSAREKILPLLHDPVQDVRRAALTALNNLDGKDSSQKRATSSKTVNGVRSWIVETTDQQNAPVDESDWKARLRSIIEP